MLLIGLNMCEPINGRGLKPNRRECAMLVVIVGVAAMHADFSSNSLQHTAGYITWAWLRSQLCVKRCGKFTLSKHSFPTQTCFLAWCCRHYMRSKCAHSAQLSNSSCIWCVR